LEAEKEKRMRLGKKYKKGVKAANVVDYILATLIMGLSIEPILQTENTASSTNSSQKSKNISIDGARRVCAA